MELTTTERKEARRQQDKRVERDKIKRQQNAQGLVSVFLLQYPCYAVMGIELREEVFSPIAHFDSFGSLVNSEKGLKMALDIFVQRLRKEYVKQHMACPIPDGDWEQAAWEQVIKLSQELWRRNGVELDASQAPTSTRGVLNAIIGTLR